MKFGTLILLQIPKLQSRAKMESRPLWSFFNFQFILCTKVEEVKPPWQSKRVSKLANNAHWRPFTTNCNLCRQRWKDQQWYRNDQAGIPWCCTWTAWVGTWPSWVRSSTSTSTLALCEGRGAGVARLKTGDDSSWSVQSSRFQSSIIDNNLIIN